MASILVQSLKRLYNQGKITKEQVVELVKNGKISEADYEYITGEFY
jgi:hypothetical protein